MCGRSAEKGETDKRSLRLAQDSCTLRFVSDDHARTSGGVLITDEVIERLADEAERGYEPSRLRRRVARPAKRSEPADGIPVRSWPEPENAKEAEVLGQRRSI